MSARYVAALDQGTTSSRCLLFDERGRVVAAAQHEHRQITPRPGWVEHDADEILRRSRACLDEALAAAGAARGRRGRDRHRQPARDGRAVGARDRSPARERDRLAGHAQRRASRGARLPRPLPRADRPAAGDVLLGPQALLAARRAAGRARPRRGRRAGGGHDRQLARLAPGGRARDRRDQREPHAAHGPATRSTGTTGCSTRSASRAPLLAEIGPSSGVVGEIGGIPLAALLGDQHAALFGQCCFAPGEAKCTYGTGNFLVLNTGERARAVEPTG